jgi:DNA repair protein RadC
VLSDAELIAILIGSGSRNESAVALSKRILNSVDNNLHELGKKNLAELMKFKGIGEAKAITIAAAMELGRRRQDAALIERPEVRSSRDAWLAIRSAITDLSHEEFWILLLNKSLKIIGKTMLSAGNMDATVVDAKMVFRRALEWQASSIIMCHNHPSGTLRPSQADLDLTNKIKQCGELLGIRVLDHLIIAEKGFYSFADEGQL